jgi:hypothetical protein
MSERQRIAALLEINRRHLAKLHDLERDTPDEQTTEDRRRREDIADTEHAIQRLRNQIIVIDMLDEIHGVVRGRHACPDETATIVNGRWVCNCPK